MRPTTERAQNIELTTDCLGLALFHSQKLTILHADGRMNGQTKVAQVLYDFNCAKDAPPLQQPIFNELKLDMRALRDLVLKRRSTLQSMFLRHVRVKGVTWRQDIFPTMLRCNLPRFFIFQDHTFFRSKNK
jgi:hypothetical protein